MALISSGYSALTIHAKEITHKINNGINTILLNIQSKVVLIPEQHNKYEIINSNTNDTIMINRIEPTENNILCSDAITKLSVNAFSITNLSIVPMSDVVVISGIVTDTFLIACISK